MDELTRTWRLGHKQHQREKERRLENARKCLSLVHEEVQFRRVVDFGCGIGAWLAAAKELGADVIAGYEGDYIRETQTLVAQECITTVDLSSFSEDLEKWFDVAISIEVAEHLPPESADSFVDLLARAANVIVFSAARPKQGGLGHLNEQPIEYWIRKFWARSYIALDMIRPFVQGNPQIFPWIKSNIMVFVEYSELVRRSDMFRFARGDADIGRLYRS